jgi:hypothetical protein
MTKGSSDYSVLCRRSRGHGSSCVASVSDLPTNRPWRYGGAGSYGSAGIGIVQPFTLFWSLLYILACTAKSVLVLLSRIPHWKGRTIQLEPGRPNSDAVLVYQAGCALRCRGIVSIVASIVRILRSWPSCPWLSVGTVKPGLSEDTRLNNLMDLCHGCQDLWVRQRCGGGATLPRGAAQLYLLY